MYFEAGRHVVVLYRRRSSDSIYMFELTAVCVKRPGLHATRCLVGYIEGLYPRASAPSCTCAYMRASMCVCVVLDSLWQMISLSLALVASGCESKHSRG